MQSGLHRAGEMGLGRLCSFVPACHMVSGSHAHTSPLPGALRCTGSGKWAHQACLRRWINEEQVLNSNPLHGGGGGGGGGNGSSSGASKRAACPQCRTPYTVDEPAPGLIVRLGDRALAAINTASPVLAGSFVGFVTWAGLGALTVMAPSLMARSWWLPLSWAALFNACRFLAEHSQAPREAGLTQTTRDITSAWLTPFVFPHHVGLHRTHHRFPNAPWEALPRLRGEAAREQ